MTEQDKPLSPPGYRAWPRVLLCLAFGSFTMMMVFVINQDSPKTRKLEASLNELDLRLDQVYADIKSKQRLIEDDLPKLRERAKSLDKSRVVAAVLEIVDMDRSLPIAYVDDPFSQINVQLAQASDDDLREIVRHLTVPYPNGYQFELLKRMPEMIPDRLDVITPQIRSWLAALWNSGNRHTTKPLMSVYGISIAEVRGIIRKKHLSEARVRSTYIAPALSLLMPLPAPAQPIVMWCDCWCQENVPLFGRGF
ncbi:hypothetical protein [Blastopirellula marina]|uniref:Uncharacterized protein n=1 Tax=Blastopirellula marina TaxID=124 RepID=A0A2S8F518_9BACT|nr:hypothetical protein [Blastopirellula marina]PQO27014.1 hypothetical protein C5Y98_27540 [Blastopirellula marina]PTL41161.1 hypothetical protein C5Y97_27555 [Blastopirellula marina]